MGQAAAGMAQVGGAGKGHVHMHLWASPFPREFVGKGIYTEHGRVVWKGLEGQGQGQGEEEGLGKAGVAGVKTSSESSNEEMEDGEWAQMYQTSRKCTWTQ